LSRHITFKETAGVSITRLILQKKFTDGDNMYPALYAASPEIAALDATMKAVAAVTAPVVSLSEAIYTPTQRLYLHVTSKLADASRDGPDESVRATRHENFIVLVKAEEGLLEKPSSLSYLSPLRLRYEEPWLLKWLDIWNHHMFVG
jgi:hypothetical protein